MSPKWQPGDQTELPDDEPLPPEELARMEQQRIKGQHALIHRAAAQGMTPMEMFASGQVIAHAPDDALAFDKSRQLPEVNQEIRLDTETATREILLQNPEDKPELAVAVDPARGEEGEVTVIGRNAHGRLSVLHPKDQEVPGSDLRDRMQEWLAKDGGRSFAEGFAGYFGARTPRAGGEEAVPPTYEKVNDDEVAEGEVWGFGTVESGKEPDQYIDVVEAEVVDEVPGANDDPGLAGPPQSQAGPPSGDQRRDDPGEETPG